MKNFFFLVVLLIAFSSHSQHVSLTEFAIGFSSPTEIANAGDSRLFVLERNGIIKILNADGTVNTTPFLNITSLVQSGGERGLLGIAFHPEYFSNGYFYVNYTNNSGNTVVSRFSVTANPDVADDTTEFEIISVVQPYPNHNGGSIAFGPDACLYIGMGDGGSGEDPHNYGQNTLIMLGKMLRIDVDAGSSYAIPTDNPFVGNPDYLDEIWAIGLRNPWKFSFDSGNGDLWIADVGQYEIEEINQVDSSLGGLNYGWRCYEGNSEFNTTGCGDIADYTFPVAEYMHSGGRCSITGGYVYRGTQFSNFNGLYFFADYCTNEIGTVDPNNDYQITYNAPFTGGFSTFGQDVNGELYVAGLSSGIIYKIFEETVGLDEIRYDNDLVLSPNPAKKFVKVSSESHLLNSLSIYNNLGELIIHQNFLETNNYRIKTTDLPSGMYILNFQSNDATNLYKKLIIE